MTYRKLLKIIKRMMYDDCLYHSLVPVDKSGELTWEEEDMVDEKEWPCLGHLIEDMIGDDRHKHVEE